MYAWRGLGDSSAIQNLIASLAPSYNVPSSLALAVAKQESGFNQGAVGSSGEIGVFQLMPGTASQLGVNPSDLDQNVQGGLSFLASLFSKYGNWTQALEAYNGGPTNVNNGTVSAAAQNYATNVLAAAGPLSTPAVSDGSDSMNLSDLMGADDSGSFELSGPVIWALVAAGAGLLLVWAAA